MHVMQTLLKMQHDSKMQGIPSGMQLIWQACNVLGIKHGQFKQWNHHATTPNEATMQQT